MSTAEDDEDDDEEDNDIESNGASSLTGSETKRSKTTRDRAGDTPALHKFIAGATAGTIAVSFFVVGGK